MLSWLDGFARIDLDLTGVNAPEVGRPYDETSHPKICLHTTEGSSIEGAERAFAAYPPHVGVEFGRRLLHQYLPLDRCSFSLKGSESDDEFVVQVEIVGFASHYQTGAEADWLGREVIAPIAQAIGCPLVSVPQGFHGPSSGVVLASTSSPIRFKTEGELRRFSGVFGHQHAPPPDTHWDPGAIDIDRILAAAGGNASGGFLMALSDAQQTYLYDRILRIERALTPKGDTLGSYKDSEVPDDRRLGHLIARLDERLNDKTVRWIYQRLQRLEQALTSSESGSLGTFDDIEEERTLRAQVLAELAEIKAAVSGEAS